MPKKMQYVLVPSDGLVASEDNPKQVQFFEALHQTASVGERIHTLSTEAGALPVTVIDSIGEKKPKLIECAPEDLPALRASHPSVRILPVVYFRPAVMRHQISEGIVSAARARAAAKSAAMTITIVSGKDGKPVPKAMVVALISVTTLEPCSVTYTS